MIKIMSYYLIAVLLTFGPWTIAKAQSQRQSEEFLVTATHPASGLQILCFARIIQAKEIGVTILEIRNASNCQHDITIKVQEVHGSDGQSS